MKVPVGQRRLRYQQRVQVKDGLMTIEDSLDGKEMPAGEGQVSEDNCLIPRLDSPAVQQAVWSSLEEF